MYDRIYSSPHLPNYTWALVAGVANAGAGAGAGGADVVATAAAAALGMPRDAAIVDAMPRVPGAGAGASLFPASPPLPPISHLQAAGPDSALAAALVAARVAATEGQACVHAAALPWERDAADTLACQAEQLLVLPASHDVGATSSGSTGHRVSHTAVIWHDPTDPLVAQLHY